jgi:hypothetical protein
MLPDIFHVAVVHRRGRFITIFSGCYFHSPGGASILYQKSRQNEWVFVVFLPRVDTRGYKYLAPSELLRSPPWQKCEEYGMLPDIFHVAVVHRRGRFITIFSGCYFHSPGGASILCQKSRQNASVFVVF